MNVQVGQDEGQQRLGVCCMRATDELSADLIMIQSIVPKPLYPKPLKP